MHSSEAMLDLGPGPLGDGSLGRWRPARRPAARHTHGVTRHRGDPRGVLSGSDVPIYVGRMTMRAIFIKLVVLS
jgi:hypothetical protein